MRIPYGWKLLLLPLNTLLGGVIVWWAVSHKNWLFAAVIGFMLLFRFVRSRRLYWAGLVWAFTGRAPDDRDKRDRGAPDDVAPNVG